MHLNKSKTVIWLVFAHELLSLIRERAHVLTNSNSWFPLPFHEPDETLWLNLQLIPQKCDVSLTFLNYI